MRAGDISAARCNAATTIWLKHPARRSDHPRLRSSKTLSLHRPLQAWNLIPAKATSTRAHRVHVRLESGLDYDYERERDRVL